MWLLKFTRCDPWTKSQVNPWTLLNVASHLDFQPIPRWWLYSSHCTKTTNRQVIHSIILIQSTFFSKNVFYLISIFLTLCWNICLLWLPYFLAFSSFFLWWFTLFWLIGFKCFLFLFIGFIIIFITFYYYTIFYYTFGLFSFNVDYERIWGYKLFLFINTSLWKKDKDVRKKLNFDSTAWPTERAFWVIDSELGWNGWVFKTLFYLSPYVECSVKIWSPMMQFSPFYGDWRSLGLEGVFW